MYFKTRTKVHPARAYCTLTEDWVAGFVVL